MVWNGVGFRVLKWLCCLLCFRLLSHGCALCKAVPEAAGAKLHTSLLVQS